MKIDFKILLSFVLFFISSISYSQENDSLVSLNNKKYDSILSSDSYFFNVLFYKQKNDVLLNNLGPFGSPNYTLTTQELFSDKRFYLNEKAKDAVRLLDGVKPFTNVSYINASRKEQLLSLSHYQKMGKLLLFSFDYTRITSPGSYINQEMNNTLFDALIGYNNKKESYFIEFSTFIERNFLQQNGGLSTLSNFENNFFSNKRNYSVNLETSNSISKNYEFNLNQKIRLFSEKEDSTTKKSAYLKLDSRYISNTYLFKDNDPLALIYNDVFIDSIVTIDSIYKQNFSNKLMVSFQNKSLVADLFTQLDLKKYKQIVGLDTSYNNIYSGVTLIKHNKNFNFTFIGKYGVYGYRKGDVDGDFDLNYSPDKKIQFIFNSSYHLNESNLRYVDYTSNHFDWKNYSLKKQSIFSNQIQIKFKKLKTQLSIENTLLNNYIYLDSNAIASQSNVLNSISTFKLAKDFKLLNFHFRSVVFYQLTSDESLFPLPKFMGRQLIYYENYLFKKALKIQIGGNVSYKSDYYGYGFMPALNEFYTQSKTSIGNYPYLDIFINTKLKRAQIFFKYEHFNSGWNNYNYYATTGYPRLNRSFKFGVSWNMID